MKLDFKDTHVDKMWKMVWFILESDIKVLINGTAWKYMIYKYL